MKNDIVAHLQNIMKTTVNPQITPEYLRINVLMPTVMHLTTERVFGLVKDKDLDLLANVKSSFAHKYANQKIKYLYIY